MSTLETDILADLIRRKLDCLLQLHEMGRKQLELIDGGNMTGLLDLLARKQLVLAEMQRMEAGLDPFREQDPERRVWRSPEDRRRCAAAAGQCEALLAAIVQQERQGERLLVQRRDEAARQLQSAHLAGQARAAYLARTAAPASRLDVRCE